MWIRKPARSVVTVINQVSRGVGIIAIVFLLAIMIITVSDVFLRYFFNAPIVGSVELIESFMVIGGFLGLAWCAVKRGHVKVDVILNHLPPRSQSILNSITLTLGMMIVPLIAWQNFSQAEYAWQEKTVSTILGIPAYLFLGTIGLGYALMFLVLVILLAETVAKAIKR